MADPDITVHPYPFAEERALEVDPRYHDLQREGPIRVQLAVGEPCWLATSYEDVRTVYGDRRFGKEPGIGRVLPRTHPIPPMNPAMLANMDPPRHTRIRKLATAAFAKPRVRQMDEWVDGLLAGLVDDLVAAGTPADVSAVVAWPLPNVVVTSILGVPPEDIPRFRGWIEAMLDPRGDAEARASGHQQLQAYILDLVAARREQPTDDLLSDLVQARDEDDRLTEDELVMLCLVLFLGGFETSMAQLGSTVYALLERRERWEELVADPSLVPAALEELWRWIPSTRYGAPLPRWALEDVELSHGVVVRAGECILPERAVANRDEAVFPHPDELDFHRDAPAPHLSLGWGVHHCVGGHLAHLEIELTLRALLDRLPSLRLAVPADEVRWSTRSMLRSVEALPVTW